MLRGDRRILASRTEHGRGGFVRGCRRKSRIALPSRRFGLYAVGRNKQSALRRLHAARSSRRNALRLLRLASIRSSALKEWAHGIRQDLITADRRFRRCLPRNRRRLVPRRAVDRSARRRRCEGLGVRPHRGRRRYAGPDHRHCRRARRRRAPRGAVGIDCGCTRARCRRPPVPARSLATRRRCVGGRGRCGEKLARLHAAAPADRYPRRLRPDRTHACAHREYARELFVGVSWAKGCPASLRRADGGKLELPAIGTSTQGLVNSLRAWVRRQPKTTAQVGLACLSPYRTTRVSMWKIS